MGFYTLFLHIENFKKSKFFFKIKRKYIIFAKKKEILFPEPTDWSLPKSATDYGIQISSPCYDVVIQLGDAKENSLLKFT